MLQLLVHHRAVADLLVQGGLVDAGDQGRAQHQPDITAPINLKLSKSYIKQGYRLTISQGNTSTTATLSVDDVDEVCAFLASTVPTAYVPALPSVTVHRVYKVEGRP